MIGYVLDTRSVSLLLAAALGLGLWAASKAYRWRLARRAHGTEVLDALGLTAGDRPLVLGFTGDYCLPCKTIQHPALERLRAQLGGALDVREVDALRHGDLVERFGVLTIPTTVVLDRTRRVVAINYGATSADKLAGQVAPLLK